MMWIPPNAIIAREKLTRHLLIPRQWDDKSRFLLQGGFTIDRPEDLEAAIRAMNVNAEAVEDGENDYGLFWRVEGDLVGPSATLATVTIWLERSIDDAIYFITLKPRKREMP